jgi:hypothetical protein
MGYVSQRSRGYSGGFRDAFLGVARRYRLPPFISFFSTIGSKPSTPEEEYIAGYETGYEHGVTARNRFVEFTGELPRDLADWQWSEREMRARGTLAGFKEEAAEPDIAAYSDTYARLKEHLAAGLVFRALKEAKVFFRAEKNSDAFWRSLTLLDRLQANRTARSRSEKSADLAHAEFRSIVQAAEDLFDEIKPAEGVAPAQSVIAQPGEVHTHSSAAAYVRFRASEIRDVVIEKWRIAQTVIPGEYAATLNRIVRWFDNFAPSEYDDALLLLRNVHVLSAEDVAALIEVVGQEVRNLFNGDLRRVVFSGLGNSLGSSGSQFLYLLRQKLALREGHFPLDYHRLRDGVESIVFVDDMIGSGDQARTFCERHLQNVTATKYYCSLVALRRGMESLRARSGFKLVFAAKILDDSARAFSPESRMFGDDTTRLRVMAMAKRYGEALYPKGPLGYDDGQSMIVFSHNTPNNTLPIIWASPRNEKTVGVPWSPLWERRKSTVPN